MEANSRINRRSRPRPYDLRRKVLLKNFLREQMTYIPQTRLTSSAEDSHADFAEKSLDSSEMDEDLQELNDENSSTSISPTNSQANSTFTIESDRNNLLPNPTESCNSPNHEAEPGVQINSINISKNKSKISRFASLMNLRSKSKRKAIKGIIKAKKACKKAKNSSKTKSFKTGLEKILLEQSTSSEKSFQSSKNSFKSIFSLLKSRKDQKKRTNVNKQTSIGAETCESTKSDVIENSEQMSFDKCKEELNKAQKLNKLLQEENKLLSESLSYFMSSPSINSSCTVPLQDSNQNISSFKRFPNNDHDSSSSVDYNWNNRPRISRSKSVREQSNHKHIHKGTHRTRSMNCHNNRNNLSHNSTDILEHSAESQKSSIPHVRQKDNLSVNRSNRVVQRRFSMPERFLSENGNLKASTALSYFRNRQHTRSSSCHDNHNNFFTAHPIFSEPSEENSITQAKQKNVLASLPVNIAGRVVQRRSSMPERMLSVNNKSRCHRSGSVRETSSRTPFHSLPSCAFY